MNTNNEIGDDLSITKTDRNRQMGGAWVTGSIAGHTFQVLVFEDHAENEEYELGTSRLSKLWLRRQADRQVVATFERGWDLQRQRTTPARLSTSSPPGSQNTPSANSHTRETGERR